MSDRVGERMLGPSTIPFIRATERMFCRMVGGKSIEDGQIAALSCVAEGLTPSEFARKYHVIAGRLSMKSEYMLAEFRRRGGSHRVVEMSPNRAAISLIFSSGELADFELTWAEIEASRIPWRNPLDHDEGFKDNWSTLLDRREMLWARVISRAVSAVAPEIRSGIDQLDELDDPDGDIPLVEAVFSEPGMPARDPVPVERMPCTPAIEGLGIADKAPEVVELEMVGREQLDLIKSLIREAGLAPDQITAALQKRNVQQFEELTADQAADIVLRLKEHLGKK